MGSFIEMSGMSSPIMSKAMGEMAQSIPIGSISALCLRLTENIGAMAKTLETSLLGLKPFFAKEGCVILYTSNMNRKAQEDAMAKLQTACGVIVRWGNASLPMQSFLMSKLLLIV